MESPFVRFADRNLIWLVAVLASADAFAGAFQGVVDGRPDHVYIWGVAGVIMLAAATILETVKSRRRRWNASHVVL